MSLSLRESLDSYLSCAMVKFSLLLQYFCKMSWSPSLMPVMQYYQQDVGEKDTVYWVKYRMLRPVLLERGPWSVLPCAEFSWAFSSASINWITVFHHEFVWWVNLFSEPLLFLLLTQEEYESFSYNDAV